MIRMVREIKTEEDLKLAVEETREVIIRNVGIDSFLVKECTVENIKKNTEMMVELLGEGKWNHENSLCDLIYESWGDDN